MGFKAHFGLFPIHRSARSEESPEEVGVAVEGCSDEGLASDALILREVADGAGAGICGLGCCR